MPVSIQSDFRRRMIADRRSGLDLRPAEYKHAEGERRTGDRRRPKAGPGSNLPALALFAFVAFCAYDLMYLEGRHTRTPLFEAAEAANAFVAHWLGSSLAR